MSGASTAASWATLGSTFSQSVISETSPRAALAKASSRPAPNARSLASAAWSRMR